MDFKNLCRLIDLSKLDKTNIGRVFKDAEGNIFSITECHSGFVWLRNEKGDLKQIGERELRFYKEVQK